MTTNPVTAAWCRWGLPALAGVVAMVALQGCSGTSTVAITHTTVPASTSTSTSTGAPPAVASCAKPDPANPVFSHVSGNHLVDTQGQVMVPYGMTVFGLALQDWQDQAAQDDRQITAAITQWCSNYVRLQVAPANLLSASPENAAYLAAVQSEVSFALRYDDNVILSAQTERWSDHQLAANPTEQTIRFWQVLAPIYAHNPRVWFDVFNEPRLKAGDVWNIWQNGAVVAGQQYVGMQQLVSAVRAAAGDTNLVLVDGPHSGSTLSEVGSHLIKGANIAYAVHPYGQKSPAVWNSHFGDAAATVPVVADEWAEWDARKHGQCSTASAAYVPEFVAYLRQHQIGLGGWGLLPGVLVTSTSAFTPTQITSTYACALTPAETAVVAQNEVSNGSQPVPQAQGAGQLLQDYFRQYARA
jgi:hypothetical protein